MFRATMCPSSGADDCIYVIALCWYVPWLQEGGQDRLVGSASMDGFVAQRVFFISLLIVAQHVSGNHVPIIRS